MSNIFRAINISKSFPTPTEKLEVLKGLDLSINKGEVLAILGVSGVGKSTLLHILGTLDKPDQGTIFLNEDNLFLLDKKDLNKFRCENLGFVFQFHYLLPEFTALENVFFPALIKRELKNTIEEKAKNLLSKVGLKDRIFHRPNQLSFGEQQRVSIARALMNNPEIILADEPTGNLDSQTTEEVFKLLYEAVKERGKILVFVTHNEELAKKADRIFRLKEGKLFEINH
ncbi:MAG: ABC transporter ATP-binding protein [bacterium]|nr:ABC transporter ATP-binding protein [bacterium]